MDVFFDKIELKESGLITDCWNWVGDINNKGYGQLMFNKKMTPSHRLSYELLVGKIPDGLVIDHLCRNRRCVNPDHLEPVTHQENILRGIGVAALNAKKTHCKRGHEFTSSNIYGYNGFRSCKICRSIHYKNFIKRKN